MSQGTLRIFPDKTALSQAALALFVDTAVSAVHHHGRFLVALSGGSTPGQLYKLLANLPAGQQPPWGQTHVFWGDERLVPPDSDGSNYKQAHDLLLAHVPIPAENIHRTPGEVDAATAVVATTTALQTLAPAGRSWPRFDLMLQGMGSDGHTASLFPGPISHAEQNQPVIAVEADYAGRPAQRVTFTPLVINDARQIVFLVAGKNKAAALTAVRQGPHDPQTYPAQRIQPTAGDLIWLVDEAAASGE